MEVFCALCVPPLLFWGRSSPRIPPQCSSWRPAWPPPPQALEDDAEHSASPHCAPSAGEPSPRRGSAPMGSLQMLQPAREAIPLHDNRKITERRKKNLHFLRTNHVQQLFGGRLLRDAEHSEGLRTGGSIHRHPVLLRHTFLLWTEQLWREQESDDISASSHTHFSVEEVFKSFTEVKVSIPHCKNTDTNIISKIYLK